MQPQYFSYIAHTSKRNWNKLLKILISPNLKSDLKNNVSVYYSLVYSFPKNYLVQNSCLVHNGSAWIRKVGWSVVKDLGGGGRGCVPPAPPWLLL